MVAPLAHDLLPTPRQAPCIVETSIMMLAAVAHTLVGDVANVIRIDAFRSTPLIVDGSTHAKPALERTLRPWPGFIEWSPVRLLQEAARLHDLLSYGINPSGFELAQECAARHPHRNGAHVALPRSVWWPGRSVAKRPLISAYGTRLARPAKLPSDLNVFAA